MHTAPGVSVLEAFSVDRTRNLDLKIKINYEFISVVKGNAGLS